MSYPLSRSVVAFCALLCMSWTASVAAPKEASTREKAEWANEWSEKVGVSLEYSFDSSGPDAWDPKEHPVVFVTTEGPGYGGLLSGVTLPGLAIIDADHDLRQGATRGPAPRLGATRCPARAEGATRDPAPRRDARRGVSPRARSTRDAFASWP